MLCEFEKINDGPKPWKCKNCGYEIKVNAKRACPVPQPVHAQKVENDGPSFLQKAKHFAGAIVKDVANGMRRCTDEEMDERLKICRGSEEEGIPTCPLYVYIDENHGSCKACGCPMSRDHVYRNKIAWASEECPQGKWGRIQ